MQQVNLVKNNNSYTPHCKHYEVIDTIPKLKTLGAVMNLLQEFAYDTETNTLRVYGANKDFRAVDITISWGEYNNYIIPLGHIFSSNNIPLTALTKYIKPAFERKDVTIIGHNIKFDMHVLARLGIHIQTPYIFDTMIASWICDENAPKGLKQNTENILGIDQTHIGDVLETVTKEQKKQVGLKASNKATFDLVTIENATPYAVDDSYRSEEHTSELQSQ